MSGNRCSNGQCVVAEHAKAIAAENPWCGKCGLNIDAEPVDQDRIARMDAAMEATAKVTAASHAASHRRETMVRKGHWKR